MKIIWSPFALQRVSEIADYIASDSLRKSENWVNKVFDAVKRLEDFPESGRIVPEANRQEIREIFYSSYRIICRIEKQKKGIKILTVRHGKQILSIDELSQRQV